MPEPRAAEHVPNKDEWNARHDGLGSHCRCSDPEVDRLRALLHDIAVARRGDSPDVDEQWDRLPQEIENLWDQVDG